MKYNSFFDDVDFNFSVKIDSLLKEDRYGYFIDLLLYENYVLDLMKLGVTPIYKDDNFVIRVGVNNNTKITFNGIKLNYLGDKNLSKIPINRITLKEACLNRYSKSTETRDRVCYAKKLIFKIKI